MAEQQAPGLWRTDPQWQDLGVPDEVIQAVNQSRKVESHVQRN
jgi:hypothetical protein